MKSPTGFHPLNKTAMRWDKVTRVCDVETLTEYTDGQNYKYEIYKKLKVSHVKQHISLLNH